MKTRTLFLTLFTSISILLITSGLAFADSITGCVKKSTGVIYNVQTGDTPVYPCHFLDKKITWNSEGPQGEKGLPGEPGEDGDPGAVIYQEHLEDSNDQACENAVGPPTSLETLGWCPNSEKNIFIIHDDRITPASVVVANLGELVVPFQNCQVQFINTSIFPVAPSFNFTCAAFPGPPDGTQLNYVIINPPTP